MNRHKFFWKTYKQSFRVGITNVPLLIWVHIPLMEEESIIKTLNLNRSIFSQNFSWQEKNERRSGGAVICTVPCR
jgi:hypothetical protein